MTHLNANRLLELMGAALVKQASDARPAYNLAGTLYLATNGWLMLTVPNALVRGIFQAMHEPGVELPTFDDGKFNAGIAVMTPEDIEKVGGPNRISERGKTYHYTIGRLVEAEPPAEWGVAKAWMLRVHSAALQALRLSYGLPALPGDDLYDFHVVCAVRKKGVLGRNDTAKGAG